MRWEVEFKEKGGKEKGKKGESEIKDPPGYTKKVSPKSGASGTVQQATSTIRSELKEKKAWDLAKEPFSKIFLTSFMMWMSGNQVNIFSMIITILALWNPLQAIFSINSVFAPLMSSKGETPISLTLPKLCYLFLNIILVGIALYKCQSLGLLPTPADWASSLSVSLPAEFSFSSY